MTITELKQKFPLTWEEIENGWHPLEYPMNDEIDIYQLRFYFDSVGIFPEIDIEMTIGIIIFYCNIYDADLNNLYRSTFFYTRAAAETACILECFEIREKGII